MLQITKAHISEPYSWTSKYAVYFSPGKEILCAALAGLCGMPGGVIQFIFLYHPLHDVLGIHTENCVITILVVYFLIVWTADRTPPPNARRQKGLNIFFLWFLTVFHFFFLDITFHFCLLFSNKFSLYLPFPYINFHLFSLFYMAFHWSHFLLIQHFIYFYCFPNITFHFYVLCDIHADTFCPSLLTADVLLLFPQM